MIKKLFLKNRKGSLLVEVIIAMSIFAVMAGAIMSVTLGSLDGMMRGGEETQARALAQEGMEAIRSVRDGAWNKINYSQVKVTVSGNLWNISSSTSELIDNKYTRTITLSDVCRDESNIISTCPSTYTDPHTKLATVVVSWITKNGSINSTTQTGFISNWESKDWTQTSWLGSSGQNIYSDITKYLSDDGNLDNTTTGEIKLKTLNNCNNKSWQFNISSDYTYDNNKIEVTSGVARLKNMTTGIDSNTKALWHLDETSGDIIDYSGTGNNLSNVTGSPAYNQSGKFNTSLQFNGNSARYINWGQQIGLGITGAITLDAWIYRTTPATTYEAIISKSCVSLIHSITSSGILHPRLSFCNIILLQSIQYL